MIVFGVILGFFGIGSCITLHGRGQELEYKTVYPRKQYGATFDSENKQWAPRVRGQFMRDILFGIHPDSPLNRNAWANSGYLTLLESSQSPKTNMQAEKLPIVATDKLDTLVKAPIKSEDVEFSAAPRFRKPTLLGLSVRKRIPKHVIVPSPALVPKSGREPNKPQNKQSNEQLANSSTKRYKSVENSPEGDAARMFPFPVPLQMPRVPQFFWPSPTPTPAPKTTKGQGQTPPPRRSSGRCLIQSVQVPQPQPPQPNYNIYPAQLIPFQMMPSPVRVPQPVRSLSEFRHSMEDFFEQLTEQQIDQMRLWTLDYMYSPVLSRLPPPTFEMMLNYPPPSMMYDMMELESKPFESSDITISYFPGKDTSIPAETNKIEKFEGVIKKSPKTGIFKVPSLQAEVIVSSEANKENERKELDQPGVVDNEFRKESIIESENSTVVDPILTSTVAPQEVDVKSVKEKQLVVDIQEPRTEEISFVSQQVQPTEVSKILE